MKTEGDSGQVVKRGDVLVPLDRNPLELYLLALCALSGVVNGVALLATGQDPGQGDVWAASLFYGLLALGGLGGIAGAYWRDAIVGVLIVRAAMIPTAAGAFIYAVSVGLRGAGPLPAGTVFVFGVACAWRAWNITRQVRHHTVGLHRVVVVSPAKPGDAP